MTYGRCEVVIESNGIYDRMIIPAAGRNIDYFSVQNIALLSKGSLWMDFAEGLKDDSKNDALLFIHGYNTSFNEACRRAAQIAYDLKFGGTVLLYSWPSHDSFLSYAGDEEMTEWTHKHFTSFLKDLLNTSRLNHLHITAHSIGHRVLMRALFSGQLDGTQQQHLGQIILAAPDVNRAIFDQAELSKLKAQRISLYASDHDQALLSSRIFHKSARLGDTHPDIYVKAEMDTIDASDVDTSLVGHSYVAESRPVLADFASLIFSNTEPVKRFGIIKEGNPPKEWWYLKPY